MFADRTDAGDRLADELRRQDVEADIVLAIPRGGLPVARPVADALDVPLDIVVARKVGAPGNPELAVAAVADDGTTWRNESLIGSLDLTTDYLESQTEHEQRAAKEKFDRYRADRPPLDLSGERVLVVDDGLATGATMRACVERIKASGAASVVVGVPVSSPETADAVERVTDGVVTLEEPPNFSAVGQFYRDFSQVTDEEAMALLE
ncbi:phosphoribosyltransferase [Haloarcula pellucida]|uniref:Phosphoribosyltransferase n=1 Tax=Haloarcula pellucida TaxID=1427151 RepID=A0A830GGQ9_9EURY|nr:phosphoribosyltransferase family protein [Halomicroarcula pellucida]MBX0346830.1 phosphoribosyltransferase [Halomicroarcula pellucida]GGN85684.1 phosphoribosyltransferase [Halomicroarcula pellucida]